MLIVKRIIILMKYDKELSPINFHGPLMMWSRDVT